MISSNIKWYQRLNSNLISKMKNKNKTMQIGLRLDKDMIHKIEELSSYEHIDKMSWIRRALSLAIIDVESRIADEVLKNYINLRADDKTLFKWTGLNTIPKDIRGARERKLKGIA
jgi:hypothetical protein